MSSSSSSSAAAGSDFLAGSSTFLEGTLNGSTFFTGSEGFFFFLREKREKVNLELEQSSQKKKKSSRDDGTEQSPHFVIIKTFVHTILDCNSWRKIPAFFRGSPGWEEQVKAGGRLRISPERSGGFPA